MDDPDRGRTTSATAAKLGLVLGLVLAATLAVIGPAQAAPETGYVGNRIWHDIDGDGSQDAGEPGLAGIAVSLIDARSGVRVASGFTGPGGWFGFRGLDPSRCYRAQVDPGDDWALTRPNATTDTRDSDADPVSGLMGWACFDNYLDQWWWDAGLVPFAPPSGCEIEGQPVNTVLDQPQCDALLAFYAATSGPDWITNAGWNTATDPCEWWGVGCEGSGVQSLGFVDNGLTGPIPQEIADLTDLRTLRLVGNAVTALPPEIGDLTLLVELDLDGNQLSSLPPEIGDLRQLRRLDVGRNQLSSLPADIGNLGALLWFSATGNALTELPPEFGDLIALQYAYVGRNQLTELPPEIGNLTYLLDLNLRENRLRSLPPQIGDMSQLGNLVLSENSLTELPPEIGRLGIEYLFLEYNDLDTLPPEIGAMDALHSIFVRGNGLRSLPPEIAEITNLRTIDARDNSLTELPDEIVELSDQLEQLSVNGNELTRLPAGLGEFARLRWLFVHDNLLTGSLDDLAGLEITTEFAQFSDGPGGNDCLSATVPALIEWLDEVDPHWNECDA